MKAADDAIARKQKFCERARRGWDTRRQKAVAAKHLARKLRRSAQKA